MILSIVLVYAVYKFELLIGKEQSSLFRTTEEDYYDESYKFTSEDGFKVAFALSSFKSTSSFYENPSYGRLRLIKEIRDSKDSKDEEEDVRLRRCTYNEIARSYTKDSDENQDLFYKPQVDEDYLKTLAPNLQCFDDNIVLSGGRNAFRVQKLRILFESCDKSWYNGTCKSKNQINDWIRDKHIVILSNEMRFNQGDYNNNVSKISKIARF